MIGAAFSWGGNLYTTFHGANGGSTAIATKFQLPWMPDGYRVIWVVQFYVSLVHIVGICKRYYKKKEFIYLHTIKASLLFCRL